MTRSPSRAVQHVIERLERVRHSNGGFSARCPAHDDRQNSLSIGEGEGGRVLLHCFAGCAYLDVLGAIGLETRDLFPSEPCR